MKTMCVLPLSHYAFLTDVCENFSIVLWEDWEGIYPFFKQAGFGENFIC